MRGEGQGADKAAGPSARVGAGGIRRKGSERAREMEGGVALCSPGWPEKVPTASLLTGLCGRV